MTEQVKSNQLEIIDTDSNMIEHAKSELKFLRGDTNTEDEMQRLIEADILEIVRTFAKQGHSGSSASYCIPIINRLLKREPITPLTGDDSEWCEVSPGCFQNIRCSGVFKDTNRYGGKPYTINGKVFSNDQGKTWWWNRDSDVIIEFPYIPAPPKRVFLDEEESV